MDVSIIIINYNTKKFTCDCIDSIYTQTTKTEFEIILWDNDSSDGSKDAFIKYKSKYKNFFLILSDENVGFAKANNLASKQAMGSYILLLNPDTIILESAIDKVVDYAKKNPEFGAYGGASFFPDLSRNPTSAYNFSNYWSLFCIGLGISSVFRRSRIFNPESLASWNWKKPRVVGIITGCFLMMKKGLWDELNGFDLRFFIYGEDADLCLRIRNAGKKCVIYPEVKFIHYGGASESIRSDKMVKLFKAKSQLFKKYWPYYKWYYSVSMLSLWALTRTFFLFLASRANKKYMSSYNEWSNILKRRNEWKELIDKI